MKICSVTLPEDLAEWAHATARAQDRSVSSLVRQALLMLMPEFPQPAYSSAQVVDTAAAGPDVNGLRSTSGGAPHPGDLATAPANCGQSATAADGASSCAHPAAVSLFWSP